LNSPRPKARGKTKEPSFAQTFVTERMHNVTDP